MLPDGLQKLCELAPASHGGAMGVERVSPRNRLSQYLVPDKLGWGPLPLALSQGGSRSDRIAINGPAPISVGIWGPIGQSSQACRLRAGRAV